MCLSISVIVLSVFVSSIQRETTIKDIQKHLLSYFPLTQLLKNIFYDIASDYCLRKMSDFQLYHGANKLHFDVMMTMSALF